MSIPVTIPISKAAKIHHISPKTLRRWMSIDLGYVFSGRRKLVILEDVERVIRARMGERKHQGRLDRQVSFEARTRPEVNLEDFSQQMKAN
ncbi:MAG: hypothetical protein ACYDA9_14110 [Terriglobia bacterium]